MSSIIIKHPSIEPEELKSNLNKMTSAESQLELNIENEVEKRSGLDSTVLVAIISGGVSVITTLITAVLTLAKEKNNKTIVIQTKEGNRFEIPVTAKEPEISAYISNVETKNLKSITISN